MQTERDLSVGSIQLQLKSLRSAAETPFSLDSQRGSYLERVDGHLEKGGKIVVNDVLACFETRQGSEGSKSWDGQLIVLPGSPIELQDYTLVLDDGRRGEIVVDDINHRHGQAAPDVSFQGRGPLT